MQKAVLVLLFFLYQGLYAGWIEDQNNILEEEIILPDKPVVIEDETVEQDNGWLDNVDTQRVVKKTTQNYFLGLIEGKSFNNISLERLFKKNVVKNLYSQIGYGYFWFQNELKINQNVKDMISAIEEAPTEVLEDLSRYHYDLIITYLSMIENKEYEDENTKEILYAALDILLSDAFFNLAHDLHNGVLDYLDFQRKLKRKREETEINYKWETPKSEPRYIEILNSFFTQNKIKRGLYSLVNRNLVYERLKELYQNYKAIEAQGGWPKIPAGKKLRYGSKGKRVDILARRLYITGDLQNYHPEYTTFDKNLKEALKRYQKRMGLWASGTLTEQTRSSLNISVKAKLTLIRLNIEKARWETGMNEDRFILVNIPDFMLRVFENDRVILASRVIVGKKKNPTPIFSSVMSYIVLNPTWTVPDSIIKKEMIPKFKEDPNYLDEEKFKIYDGWGKNRKEIDPYEIDWSKYEDKDAKIPYAIVRAPGKENPLGVVKFMFPNNNAVYIHDTPSKSLFKKRIRAFSHGCIRLHNPQNLLALLANEHMVAGYKKIKALLDTGENKSISLKRKLPVYIRYYTVFVTDDGVAKFASDIYGYDRILLKYLVKKRRK